MIRVIGRSSLILLAACGPPWVADEDDGLRVLSVSRRSNGAGLLRLKVPVDPGEDALLMTAITADVDAFVDQLVAPDGEVVIKAEEWWDAPLTKTNAVFSANVVTFNWPVGAQDRPLEAGVWTLDVRTEEAQVQVDVEVALRPEGVLTTGSLKVDLFFSGGLESNDDLVRGTEAAVARWQTIYGDIGIDLDVTLQVWNGPSTLAPPAIGDGDSWLSLAQGKDLRTINVVMAPFVEGGRGVYGVSGSIPGALRATDRSGVLINASEALGVDGVLSAADERLLSETLAHEVGHYLGLYHPVESSYALWDSLEDTDQCTSASSCANILGDNMMFPSPVCESEPCTPENLVSQTMITHDQAAVAHRYTGVD